MTDPLNASVADRLDDVADLLEQQAANAFRVRAYRNAASTVRQLRRGVDEMLDAEGVAGLDRLRGIGPAIARAIGQLVATGRLPMLERLRGASDPVALLTSIPGIGQKLAVRLHEDFGIASLEQLEAAAAKGTLAQIAGFGQKRIAGIRDALAGRLTRWRSTPTTTAPAQEPSVAELLDVDREYRESSAAGALPHIAPRRFNPTKDAWLPVLHTRRGKRHYTALFSNTARAHALGKTHDWVVLFQDGADHEHQQTVVTETTGALKGQRVVRGREEESARYYAHQPRGPNEIP